MAGHSPSDFYLSFVSVHEQMLGANKYIAQVRTRSSVIRGYQMIESAILDYNQFHILPFDEPAAIKFDELRKLGIRIGTMDLRIAAIALSHAVAVLTRNTVEPGVSRTGQGSHRFPRIRLTWHGPDVAQIVQRVRTRSNMATCCGDQQFMCQLKRARNLVSQPRRSA